MRPAAWSGEIDGLPEEFLCESVLKGIFAQIRAGPVHVTLPPGSLRPLAHRSGWGFDGMDGAILTVLPVLVRFSEESGQARPQGRQAVIPDAHDGLRLAITRVLGASWQRCRVHLTARSERTPVTINGAHSSAPTRTSLYLLG